MTDNLERRLTRDLVHYCLLNSRYYEDFDRYDPSETTYRDIVAALLPDGWVLGYERVWHNASLPDAVSPKSGFKIHLSATTTTAHELLHKVVPPLANARVAFKFVADPTMLDYQNSKNFPRGSSGKFITVYPCDQEQCGMLLALLDEVTNGLKGPHILSDRPFRDSKVVFYRYGGFLPQSQLTACGDRPSVIAGPDGQWVPDVRGPAFLLPPGIVDPFQPSTGGAAQHLLHGRFAVEFAESFSNAGGVYRGRDTTNGQRVIIKEARPGTCTMINSQADATDILAREYDVLVALQATGYVPKAVEYFQEWEHHFLVEEFIEGMSLASYRALGEVALIINKPGAVDKVTSVCQRIRFIAGRLIDAIGSCHDQGVVLGDLSPNNIIIDGHGLVIRLIDFEGASFLRDGADPDHIAIGTLGFMSPGRMNGASATFADDWYSLGAVIYSLILPTQSFFSLHPEAELVFLRELEKEHGLPPELSELIIALFGADLVRAREIVTNGFSSPRTERLPDKLPTATTLVQSVDGITAHILASTDVARADRLFPSDYRVFSTNPLSLSYGAIGQALYLKTALGVVPTEVTDWILRQPLTLEHYTPGLYIGLAGVAWGLAEIGYEHAGYQAINKAFQSPLLYDSPDVFYGCAGTGLASLYWWYRTGEARFLERACAAGDHLLHIAVDDTNGCYWLNTDGGHHFGYAHGGSGIALFLLYLHRASNDAKYLAYAVRGLDYEIVQAHEEDGYLAWRRSEDSSILSPYWRYGSGGIGSVLIRFYVILHDHRYLALAHKAALYSAGKFAGFPGQFMGLCGMGEFLLDMYRFTGETHYRDEALKTAAGVLLYSVPEPSGIAFPGEELMRLSTDYGTGSAGIGMFLQRLLHPSGRLFHDILLDDLAIGRRGVGLVAETNTIGSLCPSY